MIGVAYVLGFISWHAAKRGPGFRAWFTLAAAANSMKAKCDGLRHAATIMKFEPPFDRREFDRQTAAPFGRSPDGQWIGSAEDLPELPIPKHVEVTREFIEFDGWVFPLSHVTKSLLCWLQASFLRWEKEDDSARNRRWVEGIAEAFQDGIAGKL